MRAHTNIILKILWLMVAYMCCATTSIAQNDKIEQSAMLQQQEQICQQYKAKGDMMGYFKAMKRYSILYDSLLQEAAEEQRAAVEEELKRKDDELKKQQNSIENLVQTNHTLEDSINVQKAKLYNGDFEKEKLSAKEREQKLDKERETTLQNQLKQEIENETKLSRTEFWTYFVVIIIILILFCVVAFFAYRLKHANNIMRKATIRMNRVREKATAAEKMKTFFIQNLSHEIRTPLNAIVGFSDMLTRDSNLSEEENTLICKMITDNGEQLVTLVSDILDVSNMQSGQLTLGLDTHRVNEVMRYAIGTVEGRQEEGVEMRWTSDVDDDFKLYTDVTRLRQLLINYLTNACKYTQQGHIHLHCAHDAANNTLTFIVTDTGVGIPKEHAEHVFERFEMLNSMKQGTGLGLNICRLIAKQLKGRVALDTKYTQGARFIFVHPTNLSELIERDNDSVSQNDNKTKATSKIKGAGKMLLMLLLCIMPSQAKAQDNPFNISNLDYNHYQELLQSDELAPDYLPRLNRYVQDARRRKEWKAELVLYSLICRSKKFTSDFKKSYMEKMRENGKKHNYMQYYFWSFSTEISTYLNEQNYPMALESCNRLKEEAEKSHDEYAKALYYSNISKFYYVQHFFKLSATYGKKAINHIIEKVPSQNPAQGCVEYCLSLILTNRPYNETIAEIDNLKKIMKTNVSSVSMHIMKCLCMYQYEQYDSFDKEVDKLNKEYDKALLQKNESYNTIMAFWLARHGQKDKALELIEETGLVTKYEQLYRPEAYIHYEAGNLNEACKYLEESIVERKKNNYIINNAPTFYELYQNELALRAKTIQQQKSMEQLKEQQLQLQKKVLDDSLASVQQQMFKDSVKHTLDEKQTNINLLNAQRERKNAEADNLLAHQKHIIIFYSLAGVLATFIVILIYVAILANRRRRIKTTYLQTAKAMKEAQQSDEVKTKFIHTLSHEIRTPLNAIIGFSTLLTDSDQSIMDDEERKKATESIKSNTSYLSTLINNILEMSRLEAGKIPVQMRMNAVYPICQEIVSSFNKKLNGETEDAGIDRDEMIAKRNRLEISYTDLLPANYQHPLDADRMKSILNALIDNAIKFTSQGYVHITTSLDESCTGTSSSSENITKRLCITIEDTGIGIAEDIKDRIFNQFFKQDHFSSGSGLGLSIARLSAEKMNGSITLDSTYTQGARFKILI